MAGNANSGRRKLWDEQAAARLRKEIDGGRIIKRLKSHIDSGFKNGDDEQIDPEGTNKMDASQVTAALGLLKKIVPDIQNVDLSGEIDGSITIQITKYADDQTS